MYFRVPIKVKHFRFFYYISPMAPDEIFSVPLNPDYGRGIYRRSILLRNQNGQTTAELEDNNHALRILLTHNREVVKNISAETIRVPNNTCDGAVNLLQDLVGARLSASPRAIIGYTKRRANCTHLYDLAVLAVSQAWRGENRRRYDIEIPDEVEGLTTSIVRRNGQTVLTWTLKNNVIQSPRLFSGLHAVQGMRPWLEKNLDGDELEAALTLHQGHFVAQSRIYNLNAIAGHRLAEDTMMEGVCYAYRPGIIEKGYCLANAVKDFTHSPEKMLQFGKTTTVKQ